ncbi:MAG: DUF424 family protein [Nanoarchaeota archaeon]|nr:DUF424 family protein [Nanoarchaeota archaeon]
MPILIKIHDKGVVSVCDSELLGKCFDSGNLHLEVNERFFKGEKRTEEYIVEILKVSGNATIVGKKSVAMAVKNNIIDQKSVKIIKGVPVAYLFAV